MDFLFYENVSLEEIKSYIDQLKESGITQKSMRDEYESNGEIEFSGENQDGLVVNVELVPGNSDIDMFVLCTSIPTEEERKHIYTKYEGEYSECQMKVCNGGTIVYG